MKRYVIKVTTCYLCPNSKSSYRPSGENVMVCIKTGKELPRHGIRADCPLEEY